MKLKIATLVKKETDDGCFQLHDSIPIGKKYFVDVDSIRVVSGYNDRLSKFWVREIIDTVDNMRPDGYFPVELLEIS